MHSDLDHTILDAINGYILSNFLYDAGFLGLYQTCVGLGKVAVFWLTIFIESAYEFVLRSSKIS